MIDLNCRLTRIAAMFASAFLLAMPMTGQAQTTSNVPAAPAVSPSLPPVVGVIDVQYIMSNAKASKGVKAALEKQAASFQAELAQMENSLRAQGQQLDQQRATLSQQDFATKKAAFDKQVEAWRQKGATRSKQLQQMENGAMTQVEQALVQVTAEIAKARGLTLIINKAAVVLNVAGYDITKEALQKLDARLASVKLPAPQ